MAMCFSNKLSGTGSFKENNLFPNPTKYIILKRYEKNNNLVLKIKYPNCKNYEGIKILVYKNTKFDGLTKYGYIDPHFLEKGYSPIARFEPTELGWELACDLANSI